MLTFLHAADFHLDSPFRALPPEQAAERRREQRGLLTRLAELAEQEAASLLFLPGDLLDSARVYPETVEALRETLGQIKADIFIAPGNHDPYSPRSPYARIDWPSHVHIFSSATVQRVDLPALHCAVHGSAFTAPHRSDSPLEGLSVPADGLCHFGCFHGELGNNGQYGPITQAQISASHLHYLALGHIHNCSGLKRAGQTFYAYPGCPEGRGFDETGEKGVLIGHIGEEGFTVDFFPLCQRQYRILPVDISTQEPQQALQSVCSPDYQEDIVRLILRGTRDADSDWDLTRLTELLRPCFYHLTIYDQTRLRADLWSRQSEDTLTGLFLRAMKDRLETADPEEQIKLEQAVRFALAALEGREEPL